MANVLINFRMDEDLKKNMEKICSEMGLSMTTAFTIFAKRVTRDRCIPFEVSAFTPNDETILAIENMNKKIGLSRGFSSVEELMEDLNADD